MKNPKLMGSLQEKLQELMDEYLGLDAEPNDIRELFQDEITSDLELRKREINGVNG